jgi:hypothetical protein
MSLHVRRSPRHRIVRFAAIAAVLMSTAVALAADADHPAEDESDELREDVTKLSAFNVKADRLEDFGFRIRRRLTNPFGTGTIWVTFVYPNTAAAKAGLRPGDRILKSDGRNADFGLFTIGKWRKFQRAKWEQVAAGRTNVKWILEVQGGDDPQPRTIAMTVPTPPPHWGSSKWQPPADRRPAPAIEPGPLADLSRTVLDNGVWSFYEGRGFDLPAPHAKSVFLGGQPFLGYHWQLRAGDAVHSVFVSRQRGHTDIVLTIWNSKEGSCEYLTSPSGALEHFHTSRRPKALGALDLDGARMGFSAEMDFWLNKVGKVTGRWPLEVRPDTVAAGTYVAVAGDESAKPPPPAPGKRPFTTGKIAPEVLKLAVASAEQRALFADAYAKIGVDAEGWAYTEASRTPGDDRVYVMRVDPSQPEETRCTLLNVNGKPPTPADVQRWRDDGRDIVSPFGRLPPLDRMVNLTDLRISAEEPAAVVFELPLRSENPDFPADRFQALFRVNKVQRSFEDIVLRLRQGIGVAGVAKITEAGVEVRFRTVDPRFAPQPVAVKAGGAVRLLLIKFSRSFEATRTDFVRVDARKETL